MRRTPYIDNLYLLLRLPRGESDSRKEVIQEQLPLPLPCYDLLPVTDPTVSPQEIRGLQVLPAPLS